LSDTFPIQNGIKKGDALSPLIFNFPLEYAIRKIRECEVGLGLNGTYELLVSADDNFLGDRRNIIKENKGTFLAGSTDIGLEINAEIYLCLVIRTQDRTRIQGTKMNLLKIW
jgi:hypothetical protein